MNSTTLIELVDTIKEKLTDQEYKQLAELAQSVYNQENEDDNDEESLPSVMQRREREFEDIRTAKILSLAERLFSNSKMILEHIMPRIDKDILCEQIRVVYEQRDTIAYYRGAQLIHLHDQKEFFVNMLKYNDAVEELKNNFRLHTVPNS